MRNVGGLGYVAFILVVVGGINYGLVGFFDYNLLEAVFGTGTVMRIIYSFIGVAAVWALLSGWKCCNNKHGSCSSEDSCSRD